MGVLVRKVLTPLWMMDKRSNVSGVRVDSTELIDRSCRCISPSSARLASLAPLHRIRQAARRRLEDAQGGTAAIQLRALDQAQRVEKGAR